MTEFSKIMRQLKKLGSAQTRKVYGKHGAPLEKMFGVKIGDLKSIAKSIKGRHDLALELYATGNTDAMYLAGLIADGSRMTKAQLSQWAREASWYLIAEYTVPSVASQSKHGSDLAAKWIKSKKESVAATGWATYSSLVGSRPDSQLDRQELKALLKRVEQEIRVAPNRVRYTMNGFVIAVGCSVKPLFKAAKAAAKRIGKVDVDVGETSCKVPLATEYIAKVEKAGKLGVKRPVQRC